MALVKSGEKDLEIAVKNDVKPPKKQEILDEDTYIKSIENIIERDFFPEVTKLKAQNDYLEAINTQDVEKLRALSSQYNILHTPAGAPPPTPASFERPSTGKLWEPADDEQPSGTPGPNFEQTKGDSSKQQENNKEQTEKTTSLDKFLAKNTSEDNASFEIIMENTLQKNKEKHAWLYEKEKEHAMLAQQRLVLPENKDGDQLKLADRPANLDNWEYTNKNALMYVPECSTLTTEEVIARAKLQEREIKHTNTRLTEDVFKEKTTEDSMNRAVESQVMGNIGGKIGVDGNVIGGNETPNVNGFRFVATPSPAPGVDASPLMTWGTIEGTPFRLDAGDVSVDSTPGPTFKIPEPKQREVLAHKLAEKASKRHREERRQALAAAAFGKSPRNKNTSERLSSMSPAAQRLASERLGIRLGTDKALRSSYSPSPQRIPQGTPDRSRTPSTSPYGTPGNNKTPRTPSLTDNLLNLPKH